MTWRSPEFFGLLILLAAVVALNWRRRRPSMLYSSLLMVSTVTPSLRSRFAKLPRALILLGLILAIVAVARPQKANEKVKKNVEGIDIMLALDISDSMLIEDMQPVNRLESAKKTIKEFIEGRVSDKIGLVVFSGESYTRIPLTLDYKVLLGSLKEVETSRNVKMGTAIGVALANSVARLRDSRAKSRVVVLLTDGENNSGTIDPLTALNIAKGYSVRVYTIGVGRDGEAQLPIFETNVLGQKIKRYQPIHSKINDELLQKLASETGGKYYRATTTGGLQEVFRSINQLEKTKIDVNRYTRYAELFPGYLRWALMLLALGYILERTLLRKGP